MVYGTDIMMKKMTKEEWDEQKEVVEIYELKLPLASSIRHYKGKVDTWGELEKTHYLLQVSACWVNAKGTVKAILAGKEHSAIFARDDDVDGFVGLAIERSYDKPNQCDAFQNIRVGTWLICAENYQKTDNEMEISFVCNEPTADDVKRIMSLLVKLKNIRDKFSGFAWNDEERVKSYGTVSLMEVLRQEVIFNQKLRQFKWVKRKDRWNLWNSVKANLRMKDDGTNLKVTAKALEGNTYSFIGPSKADTPKEINKYSQDYSIFDLDWWLPFVYLKPGSSFLQMTKADQTSSLMHHFIKTGSRLPEGEMIFGFKKKTLTWRVKTTGNKARLNYLEGKITRRDNIEEKMHDYFILNKPITPKPRLKALGRLPSHPRTSLSLEAQKLIEDGLNGVMRDLEGEFPFHLNIVYKEDLKRWYIECAGTLFHVNGGYGALKKIKTAATGTAIADHEKYGGHYSRWTRSRTRLIRDRLVDLVGDKNALWIIINTKKMGALMKAMGTT